MQLHFHYVLGPPLYRGRMSQKQCFSLWLHNRTTWRDYGSSMGHCIRNPGDGAQAAVDAKGPQVIPVPSGEEEELN